MLTPRQIPIERTPAARATVARLRLAAGAASIAVVATTVAAGIAAPNPYTPLHRYEGAWKVMPQGKSTADRLLNECARAGRFFTCQQLVNGKSGPLVIFIPTSATQYRTQVVLPNGTALGAPGTLTIAGNHWVYRSGPDAKGVRYRTTNDFQGRDVIHFRTEQSRNGQRWTVTLSGVETRLQ